METLLTDPNDVMYSWLRPYRNVTHVLRAIQKGEVWWQPGDYACVHGEDREIVCRFHGVRLCDLCATRVDVEWVKGQNRWIGYRSDDDLLIEDWLGNPLMRILYVSISTRQGPISKWGERSAFRSRSIFAVDPWGREWKGVTGENQRYIRVSPVKQAGKKVRDDERTTLEKWL